MLSTGVFAAPKDGQQFTPLCFFSRQERYSGILSPELN
jgi:hypothetical protein